VPLAHLSRKSERTGLSLSWPQGLSIAGGKEEVHWIIKMKHVGNTPAAAYFPSTKGEIPLGP